jgi:hypothetical protein
MTDQVWEAVIEAATAVEAIVDSFDDDWQWRLRDALGAIVARLERCPTDDLPARAVTTLANAWLQAIDLVEDELQALMEDDDAL